MMYDVDFDIAWDENDMVLHLKMIGSHLFLVMKLK